MGFRLLLPLLCLVSLAASVGDQVRHLMIDNANLIETMQGFAMSAPNLAQNNIKTVSINGNEVVLTTPTCQQTLLTKQQLAAAPEYEGLLSSTKIQLNSADSNQPRMFNTIPTRSFVSRFSLNNQLSANSFQGRNINSQSFKLNGMELVKYDENNMRIGKPNMPNNINRIFITQDIITFIYNNGRVLMKPAACLQADEQQLIQQVRMEIQQVQGQFDQNMRQFQQNMHLMQQNLNQNMQNMRYQMQQGMMPQMQNVFDQRGNRFNPFRYNEQMGQMQMPGMQSQMMQNGAFPGSTFGANGASNTFGSNFPYGSNNSPLWQGFPFSG